MSSKKRGRQASIKWSNEIDVSELLSYGDVIQVVIEEGNTSAETDAVSHFFGTRVEVATTNFNLVAGERVDAVVTNVREDSIETIVVTRVDG